MTMTVKDVIDLLEQWAPVELTEEWDNCGFQLGDPGAEVSRLVVALDLSSDLLEYAKGCRADMVVTHHPAIFNPLKNIDLSHPHTRLLAGFLSAGISVASFHTNLDSAENGVNDTLAELIGIEATRPILPSSLDSSLGLGRIGRLEEPVSGRDFLGLLASRLPGAAISWAGDLQRQVSLVAVCGGSGASLIDRVLEAGVDAYVTGEIRHSAALLAREAGILLVDAGHFHTEYPVVERMASYLANRGAEMGLDLDVLVYMDESPPLACWRE